MEEGMPSNQDAWPAIRSSPEGRAKDGDPNVRQLEPDCRVAAPPGSASGRSVKPRAHSPPAEPARTPRRPRRPDRYHQVVARSATCRAHRCRCGFRDAWQLRRSRDSLRAEVTELDRLRFAVSNAIGRRSLKARGEMVVTVTARRSRLNWAVYTNTRKTDI